MKDAAVIRDPQEPQARMDQLAAHPAFEPALRGLAARPDRIADVWTRKYLDHFQDRPHLTSARVNRVLGPLTRQYLDCLLHLDMTRFGDELERSARSFFELSTPFEEVLLCVHLFREACVAVLTESAADGRPLPQDLLLAFDELAQFGSSVMSAAYYRDVQRQWELRSAEARRENDAMRRQIETLEQDLFSLSSRRFSEIDRTVSRINRKLSDSSVHYREVYELTRRLEHARDIPAALGIFFRSALKNLSQECELHCGLLDERKVKLRIYSPRRDRASVRSELTSECRLSVLVPEHRESLFDPPFRKVVRRGAGDSVETVFAPSRLDRAGEYAFFPVSFHDEPLGFVWAASATGQLLTPERVKLLERFAKILSGSVFGLQNFLRNQKHAKLVAAIETELTPDRTAQWEESLDRYLNVFLDLTGVERASLMIFDPKERRLRTFAAKGYRVYPFSGRSFALGEGLAGTSLKDLKTICVSRMREDERGLVAVKSLACIPLWKQSTQIGVLNLSTLTFHKTFEASEIEMAQRIARRLSDTLSGFSLLGPPAAPSAS
jgi:GAF domain-containing protein